MSIFHWLFEPPPVITPPVVTPPVVVPPVVTATPDRYSSADLIRMCKEKAGRPEVDVAMPDEQWYRLLTEAQDMFLPEIASRAPQAINGQYATLTSSDGGVTYDFGTDVYGEPLVPLGHVEVWAREGVGRELFAANYGNRGADFVIEATRIRMPGNTPRRFAQGPYARWISVPPAITETQQPIIYPRPMRVCLVFYAVMLWAERGARRDPAPFQQGFRREWLGDPAAGLLGWCAHLQLRFKTAMAPAKGMDDVAWFQFSEG